jgi:hypothetical protein
MFSKNGGGNFKKQTKFESHLLCCFVGLFDEISGRNVFGGGDDFSFFFFLFLISHLLQGKRVGRVKKDSNKNFNFDFTRVVVIIVVLL